MKAENLELLQSGLKTLELKPPKGALERLVAYHDYLLEYNLNVNLTGFRDERESVIKNLLNALAPWRFVDASRATADVGTGGGMPGIPLAIMLGMERLALVETKNKKCDFLRLACKRFAPGVEVLQKDAHEIRRSFGQIVSIAYGTLEKLVEATTHMRAPGSRILAWKGRAESVEKEIAECTGRFRKWKVEPFDVPELEAERHMCILQV
ncbi:MAG: 16S rRNA (guanine(527)-N(7))-methyltransferase RsmG [Planctomycetes bacterium]|nr:16S rRNA (guanine(527)-N(7))-methyltransferase RsmG [Planctomycetota bacterium]